MAITFTKSAAKHGFTQQDALHVMLNHRWHLSNVVTPEYPEPADLYIGVSPDGQLLEVFTRPVPPRGLKIFHVMKLRKKIHQLVLDRTD